jgi:Trp operon repressor
MSVDFALLERIHRQAAEAGQAGRLLHLELTPDESSALAEVLDEIMEELEDAHCREILEREKAEARPEDFISYEEMHIRLVAEGIIEP